jgi:hypothetical protein
MAGRVGRAPRVNPDSSALVYLQIGDTVAPKSTALAYPKRSYAPVEIVEARRISMPGSCRSRSAEEGRDESMAPALSAEESDRPRFAARQ